MKSYIKAIQICSALWGGACFPIFPFYKVLPRKLRHTYRIGIKTEEYYKGLLANFDPDVIVIDDKLDPNDFISLAAGLSVVTFRQVEQSFEAKEEGYGLGIEVVIRALKEAEFKFQRTDNLSLHFSEANSTDPFVCTLFGNYNSDIWQKVKSTNLESLTSFIRHTRTDIFENYYEEDILNPLDITLFSLTNVGKKNSLLKTAIFLLDPNHIDDLMLFWNLRTTGWKILAIPINDYQNDNWVSRIKKQQRHFKPYLSFFESINIIAGPSLNRGDQEQAYSFINDIQDDESTPLRYVIHYIPRFWLGANDLHYDRAWALSPEENSKEMIFDWDTQSVLQFKVLSPAFDVSSYGSKKLCFANIIHYTVDGMQPQYAQILPNLPSEKIEHLTRWGYKQWRFSPEGNFFLSNGWDKKIDLVIPQSERVFSEWFAHFGLKIQASAAGKLAKQLLINIGNMYGVNMFANPGLLSLLTLFEGGKIVDKHTLFANATKQFNIHHEHFRVKAVTDVIDGLLKKGIIQAGFRVQCSYCNQHSFYTVREMDERLRCTVCQNNFLAPIHSPDDIKWSYRGLGPFSRNNRAEGIIAVILTLRFFRITLRHDGLLTSMLSFHISEPQMPDNEVDLALFYKEYRNSSQPTDLFFCECKTEIDFKEDDIKRMKRLGIRFPGSILVFATLKKQLSQSEKKAIGKLVAFFRKGLMSRPRNPVLILTGNELLNRFFGLQHFQEDMYRYNHSHDMVGRLCDLTCQYYLDITTHESIVSKHVSESWAKYHADQAQKDDLLVRLIQSLLIRLEQ